MTVENDLISIRYVREHGVHQFRVANGMEVTGISEPTWEAFEKALDNLSQKTDGYIVTPELMTSPVPLDQVAGMQATIEARTEWVRDISSRYPWARILLGTATFDRKEELPRSSVLAFFGGKEIGRQHKIGAAQDEGEYFHYDWNIEKPDTALDIDHQRLLICSDMAEAAGAAKIASQPNFGHRQERADRIISPTARTLIAVSCWVILKSEREVTASPRAIENVCQESLDGVTRTIFALYPRLRELIIVDRAIPELGTRPFNAHFKRLSIN